MKTSRALIAPSGRRDLSRPSRPAAAAALPYDPASILPREHKLGVPEYVLIALWILLATDVQWLMAAKGLGPALKVLPLLFFALIGILALQLPARAAWQRRAQWYGPFLLFTFSAAASLPWATNFGYQKNGIQMFLLFWIFIVATVTMVDSARRAEKLVALFGLSFLWWCIWGAWRGGVPWHYGLFNHDGFGAVMVVGVGMCAFLAASVKTWTKYRIAMLVTSGLCVIGVVASFARGAFLAAAAVGFLVWIRAPKKGRALLLGLLGFGLVLITSEILHPGEFWAEMQSAFSDGTSEGTNEDRWILWNAGWQVFKERPLFGVGPRNFGPFAAGFFNVGDLPQGGYGYTNNPGMLYNRSLHNVYVQILCEQGIVGSVAFLWILFHFWTRNRAMRTREAVRRWEAMGGGYDLRMMALGLEAGLVGFLIPSLFYGLITMPWLYLILALNLLLHGLVFGSTGRTVMKRRAAALQFAAAQAGAVVTPGPR